MKNNRIIKQVFIFLLIATLVCLLANINQLIGMFSDDFPHPHPRFRPPHDMPMMRFRIFWEMGISLFFAFLIILYNSGIFTKAAKRKSNQKLIITVSIFTGIFLFTLLILLFIPTHRIPSKFIYLTLSKALFILVSAIAAGQLYRLIWQKQQVELENEILKTDNLQTRYTVLMDQVNPHFLFNSLNSLSYLIREDEKDKALTFIDELSSIFRYVLQKRSDELVTLEDEIKFTEAFRYLLSIRYEHKLVFNISIADSDLARKVPFLTLQPLIENAVKHNTISAKQPLTITISTENDCLVVSNPIISKLTAESSTGIGLSNLSNRYKLLTNKNITISNDGKTFAVVIPLL